MTYKVRTGGYGGIWIDHETRVPDKTFTVHTEVIAGVTIKNKEELHDVILKKFEQIVEELNRLNDKIKYLETDLAICQTPAFFNRIESKKVYELEQQLKEKNYEVDRLTDSIYRKSDEFYNEKEILLKENFQLRSENNRCSDAIKAVREQELADIPTSELAQELYSRMNKLDRLERSHSKLSMKHKIAANMIADLKKNR